MHCPNGLRRQRSNGQTLYSHSAITPVIVCPGRSEVIALPPEFIMPQDGHDKQDCERVAGTRWIAKHATQVAPYGITLLGDDLYSTQPLCQLALHNGLNFIFVCKPAAHATLSKRVAFWQANDAIQELETAAGVAVSPPSRGIALCTRSCCKVAKGPWSCMGSR
jgi:hypothetical protein